MSFIHYYSTEEAIMEIGTDLGTILAVFGSLFMAAVLYNMFVEWLERRGYDEGYTALLVVFGVSFTLGGVALVDAPAALLAAGAFVFSGTPMIVGSIWRYARRREAGQRGLRGHDDQTPRVA